MAIPLPEQFTQQPGGIGSIFLNMQNAALQNQANALKNQYYPQTTQADINYRNALTNMYNIKTPLEAKQLQLQNQYYPETTQAEIAYKNALTNAYNQKTPLEAEELRLKNQYYPQTTQADIAYKNALGSYRAMGGYGMGVGQKQILGLQHQLMLEHPDWQPETINSAASAYINGENNLPDGTPLPPASGITSSLVNQIIKQGTTSSLLTNAVRANQADAELKVLNDYAQEGLKSYGDTYLNMSPDQIVDTFKNDEASQKKLGKFIASQALQYEAAQNRIRLANGQPGVTSTEELMKLSGQMVTASYPKLSYTARQEATRFLDEALKKGLQARQSVGIGASAARPNKSASSSQKKATLRYNPNTGDLEEI